MTVEHGFVLLEEREIPEINTHARLYRHVGTRAQLLSLVNQDENKVFGITFRTPPQDSTGVAHIMEHSVLCGSRKYPVKEPFVELLKGSLNTFLNAMTFPDKTCYPVASQNLQDFYNLIDVYMDAVFYPLIPPHTLQQEGWHYELEALDAPLTYKGVVFNEMKGAYSNPDDLLGDRARQSLFPDTPYAVDSGGDPRHIPELTYQQFKAFHDQYYHPSNARIFFYGDDDPEERLRLMDDYLSQFDAIEVDSAIPLQPRFSQPRRLIEPFDPGDDPDNDKGRLVVNWLLAETGDPELLLGLTILDHILLGTPASPLRKALIDSGLGEDLAGGGLDTDLRQTYLLHRLEGPGGSGRPFPGGWRRGGEPDFGYPGITGRGWHRSRDGCRLDEHDRVPPAREQHRLLPRGLLLMLRALGTWLYDRDPFAALAFEAPLAGDQRPAGSWRALF